MKRTLRRYVEMAKYVVAFVSVLVVMMWFGSRDWNNVEQLDQMYTKEVGQYGDTKP